MALNSIGDGPPHVIDFDYYGFAIFDEDHKPGGERCHKYSRLNEDKQLLAQWRRVMSQPDWKSMHGCPSIKIQKLLRQGVPAVVRPAMWTKLLDADALRASSAFNYMEQLGRVREQLVDVGVSEYSGPDAVAFLWELDELDANGAGRHVEEGHITLDCLRQILLDLDRSYPTHRMFINGQPEGLEGRAALFRILATYARYNKEVGYCQGMSYLGGLLLMVMDDEEDAFWGLVSLLERYKYLRGYYDKHMERIQRHVMVFQRLIKQRLPQIATKLDEHDVSAMMFATPWFLTFYTGLPCWETVLSIWDLFILDGVVAIFRVGLGILEVMSDLIVDSSDISLLLPQLLHPPDQRVDFLCLMPPVFDLYLEDWEVAQLEAVVMEEMGGPVRRPRLIQPARSQPDLAEQPMGKRRRTDSGPPQGTSESITSTLFERFVNIFTPAEQQVPPHRRATRGQSLSEVGTPGSSPPRQPLRLLTAVRSQHDGVFSTSPAKPPRRRTGGRSHGMTTPARRLFRKRLLGRARENMSPGWSPLRRSPRLRQAAFRQLDSPSTRKLVGSGAEVQLSFKDFRTSKPLRSSRSRESDEADTPGPNCFASPVELKSLLKYP